MATNHHVHAGLFLTSNDVKEKTVMDGCHLDDY